MADITPFTFGTHAVRVITRDNQPWFVAIDVCNALGYVNSRKAVADHLEDDEKATVTNSDGRAGNGAQQFTIISESGLYALVLRSRKPEARKFAKWVTSEVLPSIRQTGSYTKQPNTHRMEHARQLAHAATLQVYQAVFDAAMQGDEPAHFTRLLLPGPGRCAGPLCKAHGGRCHADDAAPADPGHSHRSDAERCHAGQTGCGLHPTHGRACRV